MITIYSRVAVRFTNPNPKVALLSKPKPQEGPQEATQRVANDTLHLSADAMKHQELYFDVKPNEVQQAPDWVTEGEANQWLWEHHGEKDGNLMIVKTKLPSTQEAEVAAAAAKKKAETEEEEEEEQAGEESEEGEKGKGKEKAPPGAQRKKVTGN